METELGGGLSESETLSHALETLKREGSNILVVGADSTTAHRALCQRLLGTVEDEPRYRVGVATGAGAGNGRRCSSLSVDDAASEQTHVLTYEQTQKQESSMHDPLGRLGSEIIEVVQEIDREANGLEPAELRMCVDVLVPVLKRYETQTVFRVLHMTTTSVKNVGGMGHYHLPLERGHDATNLFETLFDAVVEVRMRDGVAEQRWQLRDHDADSAWLEI